MPELFEFHQGNSPILISSPHDGTRIPSELISRFTDAGKSNSDCDWLVSKLYNFIKETNISYIKAGYSRYVVDLNRSPEGEQLYPGLMETGICPLNSFSGDSIYTKGNEPDESEIQARIESYWWPYHNHIRSELERIKNIHGHVILWDAHSISGEVPLLFDGRLPDLNFGTANGTSCHPSLIDELLKIAKDNSDYSIVLNERFKGGYITRHYGDPEKNINSIQLELNQSNYLKKSEPEEIDDEKAEKLSALLQLFIQFLNK
ncbi:MAG: N-formylglutamate deformylase [Gammaproteobacteria bacterium]|jgi:N-formylglutamate deformylase|nr:N-formylglutamate deformylase [Gammaproteobacteria bacterium]